MYVPDKDKRSFRSVHRRRNPDPYSFVPWCRHYWLFVRRIVEELWNRLWVASPVLAILLAVLTLYSITTWVVVPLLLTSGTSSLRRLLFGSQPTPLLLLHHPRGGMERFLHLAAGKYTVAQFPLEYRLFPSMAEDQRRRERIRRERVRLRLQSSGDSSVRWIVLQALVPHWVRRNDAPGPIGLPPHSKPAIAVTPGHDRKPIVKQKQPQQLTNDSSTTQRLPVHDNSHHKSNTTTTTTTLHIPDGIADTPQPNDSGITPRRLLRTLQTFDTLPNYSSCSGNLSDTEIAVTLVVQTSLDRVWILDETCARWKSAIVVVVAIPPDERQQAIHDVIGWRDKCPQLRLILDYLDNNTTMMTTDTNSSIPEPYPVNALRNIALDAVQTSHVFVVDVDFIPSTDLHETIRSVLVSQTFGDKEAIVVPALQRILSPPCTTTEDCKRHLRTNATFIPRNFDDLKQCYDEHDCAIFQRDVNWPGHSSTRTQDWLERRWYKNEESNTVAVAQRKIKSIACFDSLRYEPYVVIRWCPTATEAALQPATHLVAYEHASNAKNNQIASLERAAHPVSPYYDERFHGYGKNKIQHISHLRLLGYRFSVLPQGFIVHNPHVESDAKKTWNDVERSKLHKEMDVLYRDFLHELIDKFFGQFGSSIVEQCSRGNTS